MNAPCTPRRPARREAGYALLLVVFFSTLLLFIAMTAAPNILTEGKREKEEELLWRGQQYARAIRFFHKKTNRFPQSVDDLTEPKNLIRFLRKPYKDPMNSEDGSWRIITVSPTGHLIGSMKQHNPIRLAGTTPAPKRPPTATKRSPRGGLEPEGAEGSPGMLPAATGATDESERSAFSGMTPASALGGPVQGRVYGGNIIGVGSKVQQDSIRVFDGSTTYVEWEFIWDPAKDPTSTQPVTPGVEPGKGRTTVPQRGRVPKVRGR